MINGESTSSVMAENSRMTAIGSSNLNTTSVRSGIRCAKCNIIGGKSDTICGRIAVDSGQSKLKLCENHFRLAAYFKRRKAYLDQAKTLKKPSDQTVRLVFGKYFGGAIKDKNIEEKNYALHFENFMEDLQPEASHIRNNPLQFINDNEIDVEETMEPLRHSEVYTCEEAVRYTLEKMLKLRSIYISELQLLSLDYKRLRSKYLSEIEKEASIYGRLEFETSEEKDPRMWNIFQAMLRYGRLRGKSVLLRRRRRNFLRNQKKTAENLDDEKKKKETCQFNENDYKCCEMNLPASLFCKNHIRYDDRQLLFKTCDFQTCLITVYRPTAFCDLHEIN